MMRNLLKRVLGTAAVVVLLVAPAYAQSALQDGKGESSVFIKDGGGFARINPTDKSIDFGYLRDRGDERWYFGLDAKGKTSGSFASLFSGGTPAPGGEFGFTLGKRFLIADSDDEVIRGCVAETAPGLTSTRPKLATEAERAFIAEFKKTRAPEILKELTGKRTEEIKQSLFKEAKAEGASDSLANKYAESLVKSRLEAEAVDIAGEADRRAEGEAEKKLEELGATNPSAKKMSREEAEQVARGLCLREEPKLQRRLGVDWLSFRASYSRAQYKLLNEAGAFADQVRKQNFDGYSATVAYNMLLTFDDVKELKRRREALRYARLHNQPPPKEEPLGESKGSMILGVSFGVKRTNNSDDLKSVEVEDQVFTSASGTTQRRSLSKQTVLRGAYDEYIAVPLNTDVVIYPGMFRGRIAFDFFTRSNLGKTNREFVPGAGLFITKEGQPTKVIGGISFAYDDGKARVGLVGGFHF